MLGVSEAPWTGQRILSYSWSPMAPAAGTGGQEPMEELEGLPGIGKGKNVSGNRKTTAAGNILLQRIPTGVEKKRPANQPQFQSAWELAIFLEVIWSSPLIRKLSKANQTQGKENPWFPNKSAPVLFSSYEQEDLFI